MVLLPSQRSQYGSTDHCLRTQQFPCPGLDLGPLEPWGRRASPIRHHILQQLLIIFTNTFKLIYLEHLTVLVLITDKVMTPSPTHGHYAGWHVRQQQKCPLLSALDQLLNGCPGVMECLELPFYDARCSWVTLVSASPLGVQWIVQEMLPGSLLITCPIHLHHLRMMMVPMLSYF